MKTSSCKQKGRTLCKEVRDRLLSVDPSLGPDDVVVRSSGANGEDVLFSTAARRAFPFSLECKFQESIQVWKAFEQAKDNAGPHVPVLAFRRSRSETLVCLRLDDLLVLMGKLRKAEPTPCGAI